MSTFNRRRCRNFKKYQSKQIELSQINGYRPCVVAPNGNKYVGTFQKNLRHGAGIKFEKNSNLFYDGEWADGKRNGYGTLGRNNIWPNGCCERIYIGQWRDDRRDGEGKQFFKNGTYFGQWSADKRCGLGVMWYTSGAIYLGEWSNDVYHGRGVLFQKNGNRYQGQFANGLKNGEGVFYHMATGQVQKGVWRDDVCKSSVVFDQFRNQVLFPTPYPLDKSFLDQPKEKIWEFFRFYFKQVEESNFGMLLNPCKLFYRKLL